MNGVLPVLKRIDMGIAKFLIRFLAASEMSGVFFLTTLISLIIFEDTLGPSPESRIILGTMVFFMSIFAYSACVVTALCLISFFRATLWFQSLTWSIWKAFTPPFHYRMNGELKEKKRLLRLSHRREMGFHQVNQEIEQDLKGKIRDDLLTAYSLFVLVGLAVLFYF